MLMLSLRDISSVADRRERLGESLGEGDSVTDALTDVSSEDDADTDRILVPPDTVVVGLAVTLGSAESVMDTVDDDVPLSLDDGDGDSEDDMVGLCERSGVDVLDVLGLDVSTADMESNDFVSDLLADAEFSGDTESVVLRDSVLDGFEWDLDPSDRLTVLDSERSSERDADGVTSEVSDDDCVFDAVTDFGSDGDSVTLSDAEALGVPLSELVGVCDPRS